MAAIYFTTGVWKSDVFSRWKRPARRSRNVFSTKKKEKKNSNQLTAADDDEEEKKNDAKRGDFNWPPSRRTFVTVRRSASAVFRDFRGFFFQVSKFQSFFLFKRSDRVGSSSRKKKIRKKTGALRSVAHKTEKYKRRMFGTYFFLFLLLFELFYHFFFQPFGRLRRCHLFRIWNEMLIGPVGTFFFGFFIEFLSFVFCFSRKNILFFFFFF